MWIIIDTNGWMNFFQQIQWGQSSLQEIAVRHHLSEGNDLICTWQWSNVSVNNDLIYGMTAAFLNDTIAWITDIRFMKKEF